MPVSMVLRNRKGKMGWLVDIPPAISAAISNCMLERMPTWLTQGHFVLLAILETVMLFLESVVLCRSY